MRSSSQPRAHDFCRQLTANNTHTHTSPTVLTSQNRVDPFAKAPRQLGSLTKKKKKSFTVYRFPVHIGISSTPCQTCRTSPSIPPEQQKRKKKGGSQKSLTPLRHFHILFLETARNYDTISTYSTEYTPPLYRESAFSATEKKKKPHRSLM